MQNKTRKLYSTLLVLAILFGLFTAIPLTASAAFPDLDFTLAPSSTNISSTQLISVSNGEGGTNVFSAGFGMSTPWAGTMGQDMSNALPGFTQLPYELQAYPAIGEYVTLYEIASNGALVNYGNIKTNNSHLLAPTPGTTTITGGAGKVTVSDYAAVTNCKLYLVPSSLYPTGGGAIDLGDANIIEITANGVIPGLSVGAYNLYTIYARTFPKHGAYAAGIPVAVTDTNNTTTTTGGGPATYTVAFNSNGGSAVSNVSVVSGNKVAKPADPTKEDFIFGGWFSDAALTTAYDFDKAVTSGLTLYAKWAPGTPEDLEDDEVPLSDFPFADVPVDTWYYNDVKTAWEQGLVDGTSATTFSPNDNLTYAEAVKLAACMHQLCTTGEVTLENGEPWYQTYVDYAKENGIISEDYDWNAPVTRIGFMEIFANALPDEAYEAINDIADGSIPDVSPEADAVYKLYRAGIVQGVNKAHFCNPDSNIKRCEVAIILTRMMNEDARISFSL